MVNSTVERSILQLRWLIPGLNGQFYTGEWGARTNSRAKAHTHRSAPSAHRPPLSPVNCMRACEEG
eukprot:3064088-Pyramimonas_sp.AAC.1